MNQTHKIKVTLLGMGLGLGVLALSAEGAGLSSGAYAIMKRLFLKGGEAGADESARQLVQMGARHEEYELTTKGCTYSDHFWGTYRGAKMPYRYRRMWLDPVTYSQHFETYNNLVIEHRFPFPYTLHNRHYDCRSSSIPALAYDFSIRAEAGFLLKNRVIRSEPGHEVLYHPVAYTFGLMSLPSNCSSTAEPFAYTEKGTLTVARDSDSYLMARAKNADVQYLMAVYAPQ